MIPRRQIRLSLLIFSVLLGACAAPTGILLPEMPDWPARQAALSGLDHWEFRGRIGVIAGSDGFNGKLHWKQRQDRFDVRVSGPLGAGAIELEGRGRHITLTDRDGEVVEMQDAEADILARYGWTIPVESLRYWALGIPAPDSPASTDFDVDGRLTSLEQRDWTVTISQYREAGGQSMPRRVAAVNSDAKVRLVIDNWVFH